MEASYKPSRSFWQEKSSLLPQANMTAKQRSKAADSATLHAPVRTVGVGRPKARRRRARRFPTLESRTLMRYSAIQEERRRMGYPLLSPKNDYVFKKLFTEKPNVLENFLQSVLDLPHEEYAELQVVDPALSKEAPEDKLGVLDVKILLKSGKAIDVELQVRSQPYIWKRMQFYTAKLLVERMKSGDDYIILGKAIGILIADFVLIRENAEHHNQFRLYDEKTQVRFPDSIEIHILELPKTYDDGTSLTDWLRFFRAKTEEDFMDASHNNPAIAEAHNFIKVLSGDERERAIAEYREKARRDYADRYQGAFADGRQEGREEGLHEGRLEGLHEGRLEGLHEGRLEGLQEGRVDIAKKLLRKSIPLQDIAEATGLSLDAVKRIASQLQ
jgi:predicted transposase/invertase (TIGR01784 family)